MKSFLDKIIILAITSLVLTSRFDGMQLVVMVFAMITAAFMMSYLRMMGSIGKKINIVLEIAFGITAVFVPEAAVFIPVIAYEIYMDRQIAAGLISVVAFVGFSSADTDFGLHDFFMILFITLLAVYLSYNSEKIERMEKDNKKIRDEGEIKKEKLSEKNKSLLLEQDKNIYTAQLAERNRIAREIHDNVGHMLSRSLLQVGAMMVVHKEEPLASELGSLRSTLDTAMNNIRESVHDLRDESIDVKTAVLEMAEPLKDRFEVRLDCEVESVYMPKDIKYATINIIKESVSNIMKYSKSDTVDIRIDEHPSMYQIIVRDYRGVEDNGSSSWTDRSKNDSGYTEVEIKPGEGMGLENIRLRAEKLGGQASFVSGNGFRVFVRIPKPKDEIK